MATKAKETAVVDVTPPGSTELMLVGQATDILAQCQRAVIKSENDAANATTLMSQIKQRIKAAEDERTKLVKPLRSVVDMLNARFKEFITTPLEEANNIIGDKLKVYLREQREAKEREEARIRAEAEAEQARIAEEARKERERLEKQAAKQFAAGKEDKAEETARRAQEAEQMAQAKAAMAAREAQAKADAAAADARDAGRMRGSMGGSAGLVKVWKFRIVNPDLVPREWLLIDETKIGRAVRRAENPVRDIPGVEIYAEDTIAGRS